MPLYFEANQGQVDPQVRFIARGIGYSLYITPAEAVFVLKWGEGKLSPQRLRGPAKGMIPKESFKSIKPDVLRLRIEGGNRLAEFEGMEEAEGKSNYFIGNDPTKWHTNIPNYAKVKMKEVYPGIDMVYYGTPSDGAQGKGQGQLEFDFVAQPGSDPQAIHMKVDGAQHVRMNEQGDMELRTGQGTVVFRAPAVYQEDQGQKIPREGRYKLEEGNRVGFEVKEYDRTKALVIDPVLDYSTLLGGNQFGQVNECFGIAVDASGDAYVTGDTSCTNFPTTPGSFEPTPTGGVINTVCAIVAKFDPSGSALLYSTYLGGSVNATGFAIALDSAGNAYIAGRTDGDFPVTPGVYQTTATVGFLTPFVSKLDPTGSTLLYSTYLGTDGEGFGIAVDASGDAYVTGESYAASFPTTPGCYQPTNPTGPALPHVIVCELNPAASTLLYSTYLAGSTGEEAEAIALDSQNNAYITGYTFSANFPVTPGAFLTLLPASQSIFISKLRLKGLGTADLIYSTFLAGSNGGGGQDTGRGVAVDQAGDAYVTGYTLSAIFPTTAGAYQTAYGGGGDAFVAKLNPSGTGLVYSTYLGGSALEFGSGIALDPSGDAYIMGETRSPNFPVTPNAFQPALNGPINAMVAVLNSSGSNLIYSTYLGGNNLDVGEAIALDPAGNFYVAGNSFSTDFPTTSGAYQTIFTSGEDAFVTKFTYAVPTATPTSTPTNSPTLTPSPTPTQTLSPTMTLTNTFTATNTPTATYSPTPTNSPTLTTSPTPTITPTLTSTPLPSCDDFFVSENEFSPDNGPVSIYVSYCQYPGNYSLRIYNSAGEHIKTLDERHLEAPIAASYLWDGKNKYGDSCASGVYILYLTEPYNRKIKRIFLLK